MLVSIWEFLEPEYHEKEIEGVIEISEAISRLTKSLIQKAPEAFKSKLIENILEEI